MSKEDYLKLKEEQNQRLLNQFLTCTEHKTRFLSFSEFVNKNEMQNTKIVISD